MKRTAYNPYLPSWEYVPDGEPRLFDGRVYVYGSHDAVDGKSYCPDDYVCWSAPETDLADWHFEGVIFRKTDDPSNPAGDAPLFAPDVVQGPDGWSTCFTRSRPCSWAGRATSVWPCVTNRRDTIAS